MNQDSVKEITVAQQILQANLDGFSRVIAHGNLPGNLMYIIMPKYGPSLKQMLRRSRYKRFSIKSSVQIGIQLLDRLSDLHSIGYIHADLKPDNILLASANRKIKKSSKIILIDYGISRSYRDAFGDHVPFRKKVPFCGNLLFASKNAFLQYEQSRRDDLISLLYLVSFFVTGDLAWIVELRSNEDEFFDYVAKVKINLTPEEICTGSARGLLPFAREIFSYDYLDKPDYPKLKHMLVKYLLAFNVTPNQRFDWSKFQLNEPKVDQNDRPGNENVEEALEHEDFQRVDISDLSPRKLNQVREQQPIIVDNSIVKRVSKINLRVCTHIMQYPGC